MKALLLALYWLVIAVGAVLVATYCFIIYRVIELGDWLIVAIMAPGGLSIMALYIMGGAALERKRKALK